MIPCFSVIGPPSDHGAVSVHIMPSAFRSDPARSHPAGTVQIICTALILQPSGLHGSRSPAAVVPGSVVIDPALHRCSGTAQIIPGSLIHLPAVLHLSGTLVQIIPLPVDHLPVFGSQTVAVHIIPAVAVMDPVIFLHLIVCIIISLSGDGPPGMGRYHAGKIPELKIDIHIAPDPADGSAVGTLPHHRGGVGRLLRIPGHPHRVIYSGHVQIMTEPVFIGIDDGIVSCLGDPLAECVGNGCPLLRRQRRLNVILHVQCHRVGYGIILDQIQHKICFFHRHLGRGGKRIDIYSHLDSGP